MKLETLITFGNGKKINIVLLTSLNNFTIKADDSVKKTT